jgi:transposase
MEKRTRRRFTAEFKQEVVLLYLRGTSKRDIMLAYDISQASPDLWVKQYKATHSLDEMDDQMREVARTRKLQKFAKAVFRHMT